jgi:hypothetical protein
MKTTRDFIEAWEKVAQRENLGFRDYREKYGLIEVNLVFWFLEQLGKLLQQGHTTGARHQTLNRRDSAWQSSCCVPFRWKFG